MVLSVQGVRAEIENQAFLAARHQFFTPEITTQILRYGEGVGCQIEQHQQIPRCMARLRVLLAEAESSGTTLPSGMVVMAEVLTASKGRFERIWHAPEGGLWLAIAWADTLLPAFSRLLPLAIGTACCETVRTYGVDAKLKWVNDVQLNGRKLVGVLCETVLSRQQGTGYHLFGIGINLNNHHFPPELQEIAISLGEVVGGSVAVETFTHRLLAHLRWNLGLVHFQEAEMLAMHGTEINNQWLDETTDTPVIAAWNRLSDTVGQQVAYGYDVFQQPLYEARVVSLTGSGGICLRHNDGTMTVEHSGEVRYLS